MQGFGYNDLPLEKMDWLILVLFIIFMGVIITIIQLIFKKIRKSQTPETQHAKTISKDFLKISKSVKSPFRTLGYDFIDLPSLSNKTCRYIEEYNISIEKMFDYFEDNKTHLKTYSKVIDKFKADYENYNVEFKYISMLDDELRNKLSSYFNKFSDYIDQLNAKHQTDLVH